MAMSVQPLVSQIIRERKRETTKERRTFEREKNNGKGNEREERDWVVSLSSIFSLIISPC